MPTKKCKTMLQKKISKNISEGAYKTPRQAVAVAYSQLADKCDFPKKAPKKKMGGMVGFADFGDFMKITPKADTPAQARQRRKDIIKDKQRQAEREQFYEKALTYDQLRLLDMAKQSLTDEEKELLMQFSPEEQNAILSERAGITGGRMCGGSSSSESQSASSRSEAQSVSSVVARVNALREQLEMQPLPMPDTRPEPEESSTEHRARLRELLLTLLDSERSLRQALATRMQREQAVSRRQSEGQRGMNPRRLF